jgi:hypothetical protein
LKRLASILLLSMLLFNWVGYRLLSHYLESEANTELEARLDKSEYNEADLIEIKVPLSLPYNTDWKDFERVDGEIEIEGVHYKFVKRKIVDGQLVLMCLPNDTKMHLQNARDDFFRLVNDLQHNNSGNDNNKSQVSSKNPITEYRKENNNWMITAFSTERFEYAQNVGCLYHSIYQETPSKPPEQF